MNGVQTFVRVDATDREPASDADKTAKSLCPLYYAAPDDVLSEEDALAWFAALGVLDESECFRLTVVVGDPC